MVLFRFGNYFPAMASRSCSYVARSGRIASEQLLGLQHPFTAKELRLAYFEAAKKCHPDSTMATRRADTLTDVAEQFRRVTDAYEFLLKTDSTQKSTTTQSNDEVISVDEEVEYRTACMEWLGQPAEIVEESKQCPAFRQWLCGRTDAAVYWQSFFMLHGGLAPMLRSTVKLLECGVNPAAPLFPSQRRRRRPSR